MAKEYKSTKIRLAFEKFANAHKGKTMRTKDINNGVRLYLEDVDERTKKTLGGWCVSDFATPETSHKRSKLNKMLFKRERRGKYLIIGTNE